MQLPFLDRERETARLVACLAAREATFSVLYGRRRCGKSRLLRQSIAGRQAVYYVGDERDGALQRQAVARAVASVVAGFDKVTYPDWEALLQRWWCDAPVGAVLALDEFPWMVAASPELPTILQKLIDARERTVHTLLCGSSQRMMQGLVLDRSAPLYGRAREIIKVQPLGAYWLTGAFPERDERKLVDLYATWGGIPRYWELAREYRSHWQAVRALVLDTLGVLNQEPERLLYDDRRELGQTATLLALIGQGCRRPSEIAARIGKPATSLSRPLHDLVELGLVRREVPWGTSPRDSKRSLYQIEDPFLSFWFRYVEPNRSRLEAKLIDGVEKEVRHSWNGFVGAAWESLARQAIPQLGIGGRQWEPAGRWWGPGLDHEPLEVDLVARSSDGAAILIGEAKLAATARDVSRIRTALEAKAARLPFVQGKAIVPCVLVAASLAKRSSGIWVKTAREVIGVLR